MHRKTFVYTGYWRDYLVIWEAQGFYLNAY